jgi:hypothetical protein
LAAVGGSRATTVVAAITLGGAAGGGLGAAGATVYFRHVSNELVDDIPHVLKDGEAGARGVAEDPLQVSAKGTGGVLATLVGVRRVVEGAESLVNLANEVEDLRNTRARGLAQAAQVRALEIDLQAHYASDLPVEAVAIREALAAFHGGPDVGELLLQPDLELGEDVLRN